jgi:hypothetical protein
MTDTTDPQAALRDRIAQALLDHLSCSADIRTGPNGQLAFMPEIDDPERLRIADAVLAVLPATTDRADVLREPVNPCTRGNNFCGQHGYDCPPDEPAAGLPAVEYFLQAQQDDGTWEDASSFMNALDWAAERLAVKRVKYPDFSWRMAERTTTVTVRPLPDCLTCRHWRCNGDGPCGALLDAWQRCACTGPAAASQPDKEA